MNQTRMASYGQNLVLAAIVLMSLSGCQKGEPCSDMEFERLKQADRIVITDNYMNEIKTISEKAKIDAIVQFALTHKSGWATPWAGTPVGEVSANFYVGKKFLGDFGIGNNFLEAQGCGYFQSRDLSSKDREKIMSMFAVKEP